MPKGSGNFFGLKRFEGNRPIGEQVTADRLNGILDAVDMCLVRFGKGLRGFRTTGGTTLSVKTAKAVSSSIIGNYIGSDASDVSAPRVTISYGTHNNFAPTIDGSPLLAPLGQPVTKLTLDNAAALVYAQFDFSFDAFEQVTMADGSVHSTDATAPVTTISVGADGSGSGTFYQTLFAVSVVTPVNPGDRYRVKIQQNIFSSKAFNICAGAISLA